MRLGRATALEGEVSVRNPLAWAFLVVGLIVGGVVGGFFGPSLGGGRGPSTASPSPGVSVAPEDLLPFHLKNCPTPDCLGMVEFGKIKTYNAALHASTPFGNVPSNMSVNGGGDMQEAPGPISAQTAARAVGPAHAISIPEAADAYPRPRMQTLYVNSHASGLPSGSPKSYYLVTCYLNGPNGAVVNICTPPPATPTPTPTPHP